MESGSIDVGYIGQGAHKLCINGKADIFALAHVSNGDAVIGSKEKGTDTIEGLKGKTIAYSSGTSSEDTPASSATSFLVTFLCLLSTVLFLSGAFSLFPVYTRVYIFSKITQTLLSV